MTRLQAWLKRVERRHMGRLFKEMAELFDRGQAQTRDAIIASSEAKLEAARLEALRLRVMARQR